MKTFEFLIILALLTVLALGGVAGIRLLESKDAQIAAYQKADRDRANQAVADATKTDQACDARVDAARRSGEAIARLVIPKPRTDPKVQSMFTSAEIREAGGFP